MIHLVNLQVALENIVIGLAISFAFVSLLLVNMGEVKQMSAESIRQTVGLTVYFLLNLLLAGVVLHDKFHTEPGMQSEIDSLKLVRFITRAHRQQDSVTELARVFVIDFLLLLSREARPARQETKLQAKV